MSWSNIRAQIKTELEKISDVGKVNDYRRHLVSWEKIAEGFLDNGKINGWIIDWSSMRGQKESDTPPVIRRFHTIRIWGLYGLKDVVASAKTFEGIVEDVIDHFDALQDLGGGTKARWSEPARIESMDEAMFVGVLCHRAQILLSYFEAGVPS